MRTHTHTHAPPPTRTHDFFCTLTPCMLRTQLGYLLYAAMDAANAPHTYTDMCMLNGNGDHLCIYSRLMPR